MAIEMAENQASPEVVFNTISLGYVDVDCAGSANVTLTEDQASHKQIECSGLLTGNIDVIVPGEEKVYIIRNTTTGAFTVTVKVSGGSGVAVTQGSAFHLGCDGTAIYRIS